MTYPHKALSTLAAIILMSSAVSTQAGPGSAPAAASPLPAMAALLLEHAPASADPLALEQARELTAGRPGKAWKNCLVEKEARRLTAVLEAQAKHPQ